MLNKAFVIGLIGYAFFYLLGDAYELLNNIRLLFALIVGVCLLAYGFKTIRYVAKRLKDRASQPKSLIFRGI
jgi:divalent metal cation (Fe/Co/Zn/Cd) transporter